jgi:hypothetical protein
MKPPPAAFPLAISALAAASLSACCGHQHTPPTPITTPQPAAHSTSLPQPPAHTELLDDPAAPLPERIARAVSNAAPPADPSDAAARDTASARLHRLDLLLNNADARILWGVADPTVPIDPLDIQSLHLDPLPFASLYLSLFTFPGEHTITTDGDYTVLSLSARFRDTLQLGDYPHPLWHNPDEWNAYTQTASLRLVFLKDRFFAAYLPTPTNPAGPAPGFDGRWHWTSADGTTQPRTAEFAYTLSPTNPHLASVNTAYANLRTALRAQGCIACHAPDNKRNTHSLILLDYPAQALAARHALPAVLKENSMPPGDPRHGIQRGLADQQARFALIAMAETFERTAEDALLFESDARGVPRKAPPPPRERPQY